MTSKTVPQPNMHRNAKAFLSQYLQAERSVSLKLDELSHLQSIQQRLLSAETHLACDDEALVSITEKIAVQEKEMERALHAWYVVRADIEHAIGQVEDSVLREILERRYLHAQSFDQISDAMHYTCRHITRLHTKALQHVLVCPIHVAV